MSGRKLVAFAVAIFSLLLVTVAAARAQSAPQQHSYQRVLDDHEFLSAEVPDNWDDISTGPWVVDGREIGVFISAAPDLAAFESDSGPGVFIGLTREGVLAQPATEQPGDAIYGLATNAVNRGKGRFAGCRWAAKTEKYVDAYHAGAVDIATQCERDQGRGQYATVELMPLSQNYRLSLRIGAFDQADRAAFDHIAHSVQVLNPQMVDLHHDE